MSSLGTIVARTACGLAKINEAVGYMLASIDVDPSWRREPRITIEDQRVWQYVRANVGIPSFLRAQLSKVKVAADRSLPAVFLLAKSRCYDPAGAHVP